jgi:hypothetical protein
MIIKDFQLLEQAVSSQIIHFLEMVFIYLRFKVALSQTISPLTWITNHFRILSKIKYPLHLIVLISQILPASNHRLSKPSKLHLKLNRSKLLTGYM